MKLLGARWCRSAAAVEDAEGRDERGDARLGHQRREHLLHHRHGRRPASVSDDGARLPVGHRPRVQSRCRRSPGASPTRWSPASAAAPTRWASSTRTSRRGCAADRRRGRRRGLESGKHAATLQRGRARRAARQSHLSAAGRRRPDHRDAFGLGRARLPRRRPRARVAEGQRPRRIRRRTDDEALPAFHAAAARRHHSGARIEPRAGATRPSSRRRCRRTRFCWSTSRAAATRTCIPSPIAQGIKL